ncbi:isochorismatase family protein [Corynebacterium lowii]|uniref:isochorismatase n=1 Tax=Corynebacterium lowii TaxID=1544413 RepID=A0A0Q0YEJ6_9CORY|nr:isochorismatase family protein [Corynebacterium lowii]KQB84798.1 Isochorismatase [Corynebacterium lowii]MDP9851702.1 bifunctional isochorismate lyase/aryl carrier protein [Corynebacterium lowii]
MSRDLPTSIAYEMPLEDTAHPAVEWSLDPQRSALLIHDMQRHFLRPFVAGEQPVTALVENTRRLVEAARAAGIPVFYTAQPADQPTDKRGLLTDLWGPGMTGDSQGAEIIAELAPQEGEVVLTKWRYSAFARSDFEEQLRATGRDQLVISGVYARIGCSVTAVDAFMRDVQPFLVADAVADFCREDHHQAVQWVAACVGEVTDTAAVLSAWGGAGAAPDSVPEAEAGAADLRAVGLRAVDLRALLAELLEEDLTDLDEEGDRLDDWGLDSVRLMTMITRLREQGIDVSFEDVPEDATFAELREIVEEGA